MMFIRQKIISIAVLLFALTVFAAEKGMLFHYDFSEKSNLLLQRKANISEGVLRLNGKGDYAIVPNSEKMHFTPNGLTVIITAKLNEAGTNEGNTRKARDMFVSKGKEFIFSRNDNMLYFNFNNGKTWCAETMGGTPVIGQWAQYALTVEYYDDRAQGEVGYDISFYVNGERELLRRIRNAKPMEFSDRIQIGSGFGGGPWFLTGEIASVRMYERALNEAEIAAQFSREKRVKTIRLGFSEVSDTLRLQLKKIQKKSSPAAGWMAEALLRGASTGMDQQKIQTAAKQLEKIADIKELNKLADKFNASQSDFRLLVTPGLAALTAIGTGTGKHPLIGILNRKTVREIFGEKTISWQMHWFEGKRKQTLENGCPGMFWTAELKNYELKVAWKNQAPAIEADSVLSFTDNRVESSFSMRNLMPDKIIDEVVYPIYSFAKLAGGNDRLAYPYLYGIEIANPTIERFRWGQDGVYPQAKATMQFGAYYNDRSGIYFGLEDGRARTKNFAVTGKHRQLNVQWGSPVAYEAGRKGGNHFLLSGKAAIELYSSGGWYQAGRIYRKFLEKQAVWWIPELPRKSTPEWFRNNTLWILCSIRNRKSAEEMRDVLAYLREYFDLPFGIHWYQWNDDNVAGWPHFPAKEYTAEINRSIRSCGIYTIPYIDSRLWKVKDGPNKTDYMYTSHGLKFAVRGRTNQLHNETYSRTAVYSIMCPGAKGWQDWLVKLTLRIADSGFDGVYHDQVCSGRPYLCYALNHGHRMNDPTLWLEHGYWVIFNRIFSVLHKSHPQFCHTVEENAEPYLRLFDGFLVWRSTDNGQIPLYQSIYSGRAQFVGRAFNHVKSGDPQSFFSKVGQQLVNSEQIGWFSIGEMRQQDERRLYVKKAMHLRRALLPYFNEGEMLAPIQFKSMPMEKIKWGGMVPQTVTMPKIASSAWRGADGSRMWLFTNTQKSEAVSAVPLISSDKGFWICREGADKPFFSRTAGAVKLDKLTSEIWIEGSRSTAEKIQTILKRIAAFDYGKSVRYLIQFAPKRHVGKPGRIYGPEDAAGFSGCGKTSDNSYFGWIDNYAVIGFGEIDFGKSGARTIIVKYSADPRYAGGEVEIFSLIPGKEEAKVGSLKLPETGGWNKYKEIPINLNTSLTGKRKITFIIKGNAACNFAGWKYLAE